MRLKFIYIFFIVLIISSMTHDFRTEQQKYERVIDAYTTKEKIIKSWLTLQHLNAQNFKLFIRAFKYEQKLEIWASSKDKEFFKLIHTFDFCAKSGTLGPKREQGDLQTPEGIYHIDRFNPMSNFHLSLGINYPNTADRKLGKSDPGGDIFIHGNCLTVGCIPITDDKIKELYVLCIEAKQAGQVKIPIHIYPYKMTSNLHTNMLLKYPKNKKLWSELKPIYEHFENNKIIPYVGILSTGSYSL